MKCCVPGCKNDSRHTSKSQGITFHVFPNDPTLRTAWLQIVGKDRWQPKWRSAVCSEHFRCEDLYETKSGLRKVRAGAVPVPYQHESKDTLSRINKLLVCRICLTMDSKLFAMQDNILQQAYEQVTGVSVREDDRLPRMLCPECARRLLNCSQFREQSLLANTLLLQLIEQEGQLTPQDLQTISREDNRLVSRLSPKHFEPNHCDLEVDEDKPEPLEDNKPDEDTPYPEPTVKHEDTNDDTNEMSTEIFADDFGEDKASEGIEDNDYVATTDRDYSSDDSLPLEVAKSQKQKRKKQKVTKTRKRALVKSEPDVPKIDRRRKPFLNDDLNETLFTIHELTVEEQLAEIDRRQDSANYKNAVFKCTECYKGFLDEEAYNSHLSRHTVECGEHRCGVCKTHFRHPHALRKHITAHHTQRFSCNQCLYETTHRQSARLHERWHKGTRYKCPHCLDEFVKFTTYMGHIRIKHPSDFVCQLCGFSFVSEKGIALHKKLKHRQDNVPIPDDGPYCELCNVRFMSADALNRHMSVSAKHTAAGKTNREPNKPTKIRKRNEMNRRSKDDKMSLNDLRKAEGPIPCEQCGMQLENSRAYHSHFRRMHPDKNRTKYPAMKSPCMCEVCGRMFQSYALLKDHRWVHTGERPFKCDSCDKSFRMKQRLVAHRRVHASEKATYGCSLCGKQFSTHSNRQRHMFIHTGLKPFKCEMCGKGFKHASEKRAHITYVHLKKPWPKRTRGKRRPDGRQVPMTNQQLPPSEMDLEPMWSCDPKLPDITSTMDDKPFNNLKVYTHRTFETHPV